MCGLVAGEEKSIPEIWKKMSEKHASTADKKHAIKLHILSKSYFDGIQIKPLATLINMILKREFDEDLGLYSLVSATKGLTPFAVPEISSSDLEKFNEQAAALDSAKLTTVRDINSIKRVATSPISYDALIKHLKRFTDLIFKFFGKDSPLFILLLQVISDLSAYDEIAQSNLSMKSIAAIM